MKRVAGFFLVVLLFLPACQKKEEPKVQAPFPQAPLIAASDIGRLQEIVKKNPDDLHAWISLGNILMDTSRFQQAIDAYQRALVLDPGNLNVRVDMGTCYRRAGRSDKAVEEYRKAIAMDPKHLNAHRNLGIVLAFDFHNPGEAVKELEEYLRLAPDAPDAQDIRQLIEKLKAGK
jgi:cytochrome c-type biogenesis protein CcmH/NrfG